MKTDLGGVRIVGPAEQALIASIGGCMVDHGVSLSDLWRCAGSPPGQDPASWAVTASGLIEAYRNYAQGIEPLWVPNLKPPADSIEAKTGWVLEVWYGEIAGPDDWDNRDITTQHQVIALAYALFLDHKFDLAVLNGE